MSSRQRAHKFFWRTSGTYLKTRATVWTSFRISSQRSGKVSHAEWAVSSLIQFCQQLINMHVFSRCAAMHIALIVLKITCRQLRPSKQTQRLPVYIWSHGVPWVMRSLRTRSDHSAVRGKVAHRYQWKLRTEESLTHRTMHVTILNRFALVSQINVENQDVSRLFQHGAPLKWPDQSDLL